MDVHSLKLVLLFCNTKRRVDEVVATMRTLGHKADAIHGDLSQSQRNSVLSSFKSGRINILVASDVAARGIDVSNVDAVFNYDLPMDAEYYVHRIGRTGRAGKNGKAFSFVTGRNDSFKLRDIERYAKVKITRGNVPTEKEVLELSNIKLLAQLKKIVADGHLEKFETMANDYCKEGFTILQLAAVLLKLALKGADKGASEYKKTESNSDSRHSHDRERHSHDRPAYSHRPSYSPRERYERPRSHSAGGEQRHPDNRFSKERSENTPAERPHGDRSNVRFRKRRGTDRYRDRPDKF